MENKNLRDEDLRTAKHGDIITQGMTRFRVNEVADGHVWGTVIDRTPGECCRICGAMRRADKQHKACKGSPGLRFC
jgi:hypothetical protein